MLKLFHTTYRPMGFVGFIELNCSGFVNGESGRGISFNVTFFFFLHGDDIRLHDSANDH